jgi:hypothetical protein
VGDFPHSSLFLLVYYAIIVKVVSKRFGQAEIAAKTEEVP